MAATGTATDGVHLTADATLVWFEPDPTVAYGFCSICGSSMFWRAADRPEHLSICAGVLDRPTGLRTASAWWMADHGDYHTPEPDVVEHVHDG